MSRVIRNWSKYNQSLINRGSINFWISEDAIESWLSSKRTGKAGRPELFSDEAIIAACMVRFFFNLTLRAAQGFINSVFELMKIPLHSPNYTRISRRMRELNLDYKNLSKTRPTDIVIDATGVKVYGDGEWHRKIHGKTKRRKWRKMTLGVCPDTHDILFNITSDDSLGDIGLFQETFSCIPKSVRRVYMDGAGDTHETYRQARIYGMKLVTPPRKGAKYRIGKNQTRRDKHIREIYRDGNTKEAMAAWKKRHGYHKRSLAETAISRFKGILGTRLKSRSMLGQLNEMMLKTQIINQINTLGLPERG